jgi:hypothetical protein
MNKVVELLFCLPGSNASIDRLFSHINYSRSEEQSQIHVNTIQTILSVKTNTDLSYEAFSEKIASNPGVEKKIFFR